MDIKIKIINNFQIEAKTGSHLIKSDQSKEAGGDETAPNPYEYFLASIGLCTAHYVNAFCKQRNIETKEIEIIENISKDHTTGKVSFDTRIKLPASFPEKYKDALLKTAEACTVKKAIQSTPEFKLSLV
ncbi:MAG: OsmC family protein [bacterium]